MPKKKGKIIAEGIEKDGKVKLCYLRVQNPSGNVPSTISTENQRIFNNPLFE